MSAPLDVTRIEVPGAAPYPVLIGARLLPELAALIGGSPARVAVLHQPAVTELAGQVAQAAGATGARVHLIELPDGEAAKTLATAGRCWERLGELGFTRSDVVVSVGGGTTTDLAGWVAAAWLRGVRVVHVATTLAAMVDAAVGGKTGINTASGKNLVGAFHPPAGVLCELSALTTLPAPDYAAGLAEVVKCGFIADPAILSLIEKDPAAALRPGNPAERELIRRSVQVKADVVGVDLTEQGLRENLNYGHTLAHAIERLEGYRWRHGDAVSVGLVFAARLSNELGRLDAATADRHESVLGGLGLPVRYTGAPLPALLEVMRVDKKTRGSVLRFVVLDALARPARAADPGDAALTAAFARIADE